MRDVLSTERFPVTHPSEGAPYVTGILAAKNNHLSLSAAI